MATNYHEAIATLQKRFGNKQLIVDRHLDVLFNIEPVVNTTNVRGLRHWFDTVISHIQSLQSLKVQSVTYASTFSPTLLTKSPQELWLIVSRSLPSDQWDLNVMLQAIEKELNAWEQSGVTEARQPQQQTAAALISASSQPVCCYCSHSHKSANCEFVVHIGAKKQSLKRAGHCFICLKKGHLSWECRLTGRCKLCKGRHHPSICHQSASSGADNQHAVSNRRVSPN